MLGLVSVIIPCRNEARFIGKCLDSIISGDFPKDKLEVLIVDGDSEDRTGEVVADYARRHSFIRLLHNARRIVPAGLNAAIRSAQGEIVLRMDAHAVYASDYITKCVRGLNDTAADAVGGIWITLPGDASVLAKVIALVLSHPFGVGNSHFRLGLKTARQVDTVPFGCYRRNLFTTVGYFNEELVRNQDIEFNLRLKRAGGTVLLLPDIVCYYYARANLIELGKQCYGNGFWVIYSHRFCKKSYSARHLVPFMFVCALLGGLLLAAFSKIALQAWLGMTLVYIIANLACSTRLAIKNKIGRLHYFFTTFFLMHAAYGLGSLAGFFRLLRIRAAGQV